MLGVEIVWKSFFLLAGALLFEEQIRQMVRKPSSKHKVYD